jgi:hypothetical protein
MNAIRIALILCAALIATACLPVTTKSPIGSTQGFVMDQLVLGTWKGTAGTETVPSYFHFLPGKEGTIMAIVVTPANQQDDGGWGAFALQTVLLGANHFMNAQEVSDNGKVASGATAERTTPLLYKMIDGKMVLYMLDEKDTAAAIKAGKIAGTVEPGDYGDVSITAEPAVLDAFMQTPEGLALFKEPFATLTRAD